MQKREPRIGERPTEAGFQLRRQADLGHEHQRLLAARQDLRDEVQINLGLAASSDAVQKERAEVAERRGDALLRGGLPGRRPVLLDKSPRTRGLGSLLQDFFPQRLDRSPPRR